MRYDKMTTSTDIENCMSITDPLELTNCIRAQFGLPPITAGTIPVIDNATISCLQSILTQYNGPIDSTGHMLIPFQSVIDMIDKVRACVGLPAINIPNTTNCIMTNCIPMTDSRMPTDITMCMKGCLPRSMP